jgi:hypothetical protein
MIVQFGKSGATILEGYDTVNLDPSLGQIAPPNRELMQSHFRTVLLGCT